MRHQSLLQGWYYQWPDIRCCFGVSWWQPCCLSSQLVYLLLLLFSAQFIHQISSLFPPSLQLISSVAHAVLMLCFYLLLDVVIQESNQVCQNLHILPIFSSWKVDPRLFFFLLSFACILSFTCSLFIFRVTKFNARLADADIRGSFFAATTWNCNLVFGCFTSWPNPPHLVYQIQVQKPILVVATDQMGDHT